MVVQSDVRPIVVISLVVFVAVAVYVIWTYRQIHPVPKNREQNIHRVRSYALDAATRLGDLEAALRSGASWVRSLDSALLREIEDARQAYKVLSHDYYRLAELSDDALECALSAWRAVAAKLAAAQVRVRQRANS